MIGKRDCSRDSVMTTERKDSRLAPSECISISEVDTTQRRVRTMADKKPVEKKGAVEETSSGFELLDFRTEGGGNRAFKITMPEVKMRKIYSSRKRKFLVILEGESNNMLIGGALVKKDVGLFCQAVADKELSAEEVETKLREMIRINTWVGVADKNSRSSEPTMSEINL